MMVLEEGHLLTDDWTAVEIERRDGTAPLVLVCEHASNLIPPELESLGLEETARHAHIAWDIGAHDLARGLSARLDAPLIAGGVSRLVYDLNRPLDRPDATPDRSEAFDIPGNRGLRDAMRRDRHARLHDPFHTALSDVLAQQDVRCGGLVDLVTVHSFTPVYHGVPRDVQIGFVFHENDAFARALLKLERRRGTFRAALNDPYGPADGVTHSLALHGDGAGRRAVMVEVANNLIATPDTADAMAEHLSVSLRAAVSGGRA